MKPDTGSTDLSSTRYASLMLAIVYTLFVIYGSLVPLDFHPSSWESSWEKFRHIRLLDIGTQGRADWMANGVLYVPVGFLLVTVLTRFKTHRTPALTLIGSLLFSFSLAVAVEFAQLFFPPRTVSLNDLIAECLGSVMGVVLALCWSDRYMSFLRTLISDPHRLSVRLLKAYGISYIAFSLFPYDFLVSASELQSKLHSASWGWLVASASLSGNLLYSLAKVLTEFLAALPLGLMICHIATKRRSCSPARVFLYGVILGLLIEVAQFFIVSGVSQGLSVVTRAMGMYLGVLLWQHRSRLHPILLASGFRRFSVPLSLFYLVALAAMNGWFEYRWTDTHAAANTFRSVHFLPFYYHYYTTEQAALISLTAVSLMYAPIGIMLWAFWSPPALAMLTATLIAGFMESSKLFLENSHPDPTNLLIAGSTAWAAAKLAGRIASVSIMSVEAQQPNETPQAATGITRRPLSPADNATLSIPAKNAETKNLTSGVTATAMPPVNLQRPSSTNFAIVIAGLVGVIWGVVSFPVQPALLGVLLVTYATLIWFRPQYILIVVPSALALLDLTHWSGRVYIDAFDFILLSSITVGYVRLPPVAHHIKRDRLFLFLAAVLGLSYAISTARGLLPWQMPDANSFTGYYSPYNALRIAKGALCAFLFYGLLERLASTGQDVKALFARGMIIGLAGTVAVILWERFTFPGLFNFTDAYRVTGPFSQMHTGGAEIESYLTLSMPFLVAILFEQRSWITRIAGTTLLIGATYAVMVTFSRIGYAGYAIALVITLLAATARSGNRLPADSFKRGIVAIILALLALAVVLPVLQGPFIQERFAKSGSDLKIRISHWSDALRMRDTGWPTVLFGMGIGRYPEIHFWRSNESRAASYQLGAETNNTFLRLGSGSPLYLEQFITLAPQQSYVLSMNIRSDQPDAKVALSICEKWLLTSARCMFETIEAGKNGTWQPVQTNLQSGDVGSGPRNRPIKLSIFNPIANSVVDVDNVRLQAKEGGDLLVNGDFSQGLDRWFFSVDNDKPWHIWSLPIQVLFDQGWLGVIALSLFVALGLWRASRDAWHGDTLSGAILASSVGILVIGSLDSLVDNPRFLMLFLLLIGFCRGSEKNLRPT